MKKFLFLFTILTCLFMGGCLKANVGGDGDATATMKLEPKIDVVIQKPLTNGPLNVFNPNGFPVTAIINGGPRSLIMPGRNVTFTLPQGTYNVEIVNQYGQVIARYQETVR